MVTNAPVARCAAVALAVLVLAGCPSSSGDVPFPFPPDPQPGPNRAPVASDDTARAPHRGEVSIFPLGNDTDPDYQPFFLASFTQPVHGSVSAQPYSLSAGLQYRAPAGFEGVDTFTYTITDGELRSEPATVRVTVAPNTPPSARGDSLWSFEDTPATLHYDASDVEDQGVRLRAEVVTTAAHGQVTLRTTPEHALVYTPDPNWAGTDAFTYRVFDTDGAASEPAAVRVTVHPVDDAPVLEVASFLVTDEDTPLEFTVKATDVDSPPGAIALSVLVSGAPVHGTLTTAGSAAGTVTFRYFPDRHFSGVDAVTFSASDAPWWSASRRVEITVNPVNDAPVAGGGWGITSEDQATELVLSGTDVESPATALWVELVTLPHGTVTPTSGPAPLRVRYTPQKDWAGTDRLAYRVVDPGGALSDPAEADVLVAPVDDPPQATAVAPVVTVEDSPVQLTLTGTDPDDAVTALVVTIDQPPVHGAVSARSGIAPLAVTWTPAPGWSGKDQLTFRVRDLSGALSAPAVVALEATPDPDAPVAIADTAVACAGAATRIRVLANDADADGDPLVIASVTRGLLGTTRVDGDGVVYTAPAGAAGKDAFTYVVGDGTGRTAPGKVTVELAGPEVRSLLPASGTTGGPLQISGRCLGAEAGTVTIGGRPAAVTTWTPRLVVVTVPTGFDPGSHEVVVTPRAAPVVRSSYEVVPWIARVEPFLVEPEAAQTVVGDGFVTAPGTVGYGGVVATVDAWSRSAIRSRMPGTGPWKLSAVTSTGATTNVYPVTGAGPDTWWTERVPAGRSEHTAVWTGTEMIVFGGRPGSGGTPLGDGGRYDPRHDSWIPISPPGALAGGRTGHSAVWTGTELIVWGGATGGSPGQTGTGLRYDPRSDAWTPTATATSTAWAPAAREAHSAVWTGTRMLVWGGVSWTQLSDGASYDPAEDRWESLPGEGAPSPRQGHVAVWTGKEMIVWGGLGPGGYLAVGTGARYDPAKKTWAAMSDRGAPSPRGQAAAVWTGEELVVWGGWSGGAYLGDGARYDPASDTWRPLPAGAPAPRSGASAVWTGTELIVWSGGDAAGAVASGGRYDPANDVWDPLDGTTAHPPRRNHSTIWTGAELIAWGGVGGLDTGVRFAPATGTWTATRHGTPGEPTARRDHAWACLPGGDLVVWGGSVAGGGEVRTGARYRAATGSWTPLEEQGAPSAREGATAVWTGSHLLVWGGMRLAGGTVSYLGDGARYDPATDEWTALSTTGAPAARTGHTATWAGGRMVVFGGRAGAHGLATGAAYDPVTDTWEALPTSGAPSGRWQHTAVAAGGEVIVWGGQSASWSSPLATGARLDLASWAWVPLPAGPTARSRHAAVWTGEEMIVLGGTGYTAGLASGGRWIPRLGVWAALDAPTALVDHAAAWTGTQVVAWGGASGAGPLRYAPASRKWSTSASAASAPALRARPSLCWTGAEVVIWGGASGTSGVGQLGRYRP